KKTEFITRNRKVMYSEFTGTSSVRMKIQYQLVSAETGTILVSDIFEDQEEENLNYISYEGNSSNLFPGTWRSRNEAHPSDRILLGFRHKNEVDQLLSGKREFRPMNDML